MVRSFVAKEDREEEWQTNESVATDDNNFPQHGWRQIAQLNAPGNNPQDAL